MYLIDLLYQLFTFGFQKKFQNTSCYFFISMVPVPSRPPNRQTSNSLVKTTNVFKSVLSLVGIYSEVINNFIIFICPKYCCLQVLLAKFKAK